MARPKEIIDISIASKAKEQLKKIPDHKVCERLKAIASCHKHPISTVASVFGTSRQAVWRWIKRFKENGVEGLIDLPRGHNPAKLSEDQKKQVEKWVRGAKNSKGEPIHWTIKKLAGEIENKFGIKVGKTPLWLFVRGLGLRQKVPRPSHTKADPEAQKAFKKNG